MIHDLLITRLSQERSDSGWSLEALRYEDPLLHRIGLIEVVHLVPGARTPFRLRHRADEVWVLVEGDAQFLWHDRRNDSPTRGETQDHIADQPTRVLTPFGVAFGVQAGAGGATLMRLATEDKSRDDRVLDWPPM